ncbi:PHD finger protein 21A-like [Argonauta hians]
MAKEDLDKIQAELKAAIQNHQILVGKMQFDPQNASYKKQLHDLQIEITSLDDRQKVIVQILRKELVNKQQTSNQASSLNTNASQQLHHHHHHHHHHHQQQVHGQQPKQQQQQQQQHAHPPPPPHQQQQQQQQSNSVPRQKCQSPMLQQHSVPPPPQRHTPSPQRQQQQSQSPQRQQSHHSPTSPPAQQHHHHHHHHHHNNNNNNNNNNNQQQQQQQQQHTHIVQQSHITTTTTTTTTTTSPPSSSSSPQKQKQQQHHHHHQQQQQQQQLQPHSQQITPPPPPPHNNNTATATSTSPRPPVVAATTPTSAITPQPAATAPTPHLHAATTTTTTAATTAATAAAVVAVIKTEAVKCAPPPLPPPPPHNILNTPHSRVGSPTVTTATTTTTTTTTGLSSRSNSPPIRVPQYTISKALLQSKNQMAPPNVLPPKRSCTESDVGDTKKTVDKKPHITCEEKNIKSSQNMLRKLQYMASLDLVTPETLKELQSKRSERKRRSTANPQFSYSLESDRKRMNYLVGSNITTGTKRPRGRPPKHGTSPTNSRPGSPDSSDSNASIKNGIVNGSSDDIHEGLCFVCQKAGRLLICDGCGMAYHPTCLEPPVASFPNGPWRCYKCQNEKTTTGGGGGGGGSVTLDIVHNYIINKTAKDEERKKLQRRNTELNNERIQLETDTKQLSQSLYQCIQQKQELLNTNKTVQQSADNINNFLQIFQS